MKRISDKQYAVIHSLLYLLQKQGGTCDIVKLFKLFYFAELEHLKRYGSRATDDRFLKLERGPVPEMAYEMVKTIRDNKKEDEFLSIYTSLFETPERDILKAKGAFDEDMVSDSIIVCLDAVLKEKGALSAQQLSELSHEGKAWKNAKDSGYINEYDIAQDAGLSKSFIKYKKEMDKVVNTLSNLR